MHLCLHPLSLYLSPDNAYDPDVNAKQFWIDKTQIKEQDCLIFMDNGNGLDYERMHKMLRYGQFFNNYHYLSRVNQVRSRQKSCRDLPWDHHKTSLQLVY